MFWSEFGKINVHDFFFLFPVEFSTIQSSLSLSNVRDGKFYWLPTWKENTGFAPRVLDVLSTILRGAGMFSF